MEESDAKLFLERNRSAVVDGVREVKRLVDFLIEKEYLRGEMPNEILKQNTKQDQIRELYSHLNTNIGFKLMLEWLRDNEPDLIEDLGKRPRSSAEAMDQTDSDPNMPKLRCLATLDKLEKWVSVYKNSQNLIDMLDSKLAKGEMDALEKQLMNKKLKKGLYFNSKDIKDISSNQKLQSFFDTYKDAKFPDLPLKLFFEKDRGLASAIDDDDDDDDDDDVTDSAYGSSFSASYSSNLLLFSKHLSQSQDQLQMNCDPDPFTQSEGTDMASQKECRGFDLLKQKQELPDAHCQHGSLVLIQHADKDGTPLEEPMDTQDMLNEPSIQSTKEMPFGKPCAPEPLLCTSLQGQDGNCTGVMCISEAVKNQTDRTSYRNSVSFTLEMPDQIMSSTCGDVQARFCSTPLTDSVKTALKLKRRKQQNKRKLKINDKGKLLYEWAKKKCPKGSEKVDEEVTKVFDCISFENHAQHSEYPCFNTENVMVYKNPETGERQIIVTDEKNSAAKKNLPKEIKLLLNYQMWVCGITKAVLINQKEREIQFDLQFLEGIKNRCERFVFEALAPALAVFKKLQRQERLYSLIKNH